jgi:hypothetical protein
MRRFSFVSLSIFSRFAIIFALSTLPIGVQAASPVMRAHFIDVHQGASELFEFPCGAVLIDTGAGDEESTDALVNYLRGFFARRTDLNDTLSEVIITHPHKDHTWGLKKVAQNFKILNYVDDGEVRGSGKANVKWIREQVEAGEYAFKIREVRDKEITALPNRKGLTDKHIDPVKCDDCDPKIVVLSGGLDENPGWAEKEFDNLNNHTADGKILSVPHGWVLLPPGDAALTRRVKAADDHWVVQEKKGRKIFSRGVWAPAATINRIQAELKAERSTESFAKRKQGDAKRRDKAHAAYAEDFTGAVVTFLAVHPAHADLAQQLARVVADHATPVGSGTVARTKRIPLEQRAEAAVIAWMRHQTTGNDVMKIPRFKGKRREVRRTLAQRSKELLARYRRGDARADECPLVRALGLNSGVNED